MPSRTKKVATTMAALPSIPKELIDHFVTGPMTGAATALVTLVAIASSTPSTTIQKAPAWSTATASERIFSASAGPRPRAPGSTEVGRSTPRRWSTPRRTS